MQGTEELHRRHQGHHSQRSKEAETQTLQAMLPKEERQ